MGFLLARRRSAGFCSAVGQFLGVSGVLEQTERLHEHMFVYQLLVLWWGVYWHSGALRESRNVTLGTARCDLPPLSFSAAGRHLGVAPCPALDFPRANRRSRSVRL
jgi:hypothetical protein